LKYLSVCSGIEAATVAWHPLGWQPFAFAEIEKFPSAVLAHHYPSIPNLGDMTKFKDWPDADIDILVGGTPCQSFSVAGLRKGMADPRGNLALTYLAIADRYRPEWLLWENVPGVLSSSGGRDFGAFIGGLAELGYHASWRVLDAQYVRVDGFARAVPQRRRRVFVVGHLGDWRRPAAVLFERESLLWDSPPRRKAGERVAPTIASRPTGGGGLGTDFDCDGGLIAKPLLAGGHANNPLDENLVVGAMQGGGTPNGHGTSGINRQLVNAGYVVPVAFNWQNGGGYGNANDGLGISEDHTPPVSRSQVAAVAFAVRQDYAVRRLTPGECESLQGFKRGYTAIPRAADGPRYKALGNSMAVNVMRWLGGRIAMASALPSPQ